MSGFAPGGSGDLILSDFEISDLDLVFHLLSLLSSLLSKVLAAADMTQKEASKLSTADVRVRHDVFLQSDHVITVVPLEGLQGRFGCSFTFNLILVLRCRTPSICQTLL